MRPFRVTAPGEWLRRADEDVSLTRTRASRLRVLDGIGLCAKHMDCVMIGRVLSKGLPVQLMFLSDESKLLTLHLCRTSKNR